MFFFVCGMNMSLCDVNGIFNSLSDDCCIVGEMRCDDGLYKTASNVYQVVSRT